MRSRQRLFSFLASLVMIVPTLVAIPVAAFAQVGYQLNVSTNSDRSGAVPLGGATVDGDIYVFTSPDDDVDIVRFWIDSPTGSPFRTEFSPPYDLAGGPVSNAARFDSTILSDGLHNIYAELEFNGGGTEMISAPFTVVNSTPSLQFDTSSVAFDLELGDPVASDTVNLSATSGAANYALTVVQNPEGSSWLSVDPLAGSTSDAIDLAVDPAGLGAGLYTATVIASAPGYVGDSVSITMNLTDPTAPDGLQIAFSTLPSRGSPADLDGAVVSDSIYVFVTDETGVPEPNANITQVRFFTNGSPSRVENFDPWDYLGGSLAAANPFDTTGESDGSFQISAQVDVTGEGTTTLVADFQIQNSGPPVPVVSLAPGTLNFGNVEVGTSPVDTVVLTNVGAAPLTVGAISANGAGFGLLGDDCPAALSPGSSCDIDIEFSPTTATAYNGDLSVESNAVSSPDVVPLAGTGVVSAPVVQLSPATLSFGDVVTGNTPTNSVTLTNVGNAPLSITDVTVTGAGFSDAGSTCGASLSAGTSCSIDVQFAPTSVAPYSGSMTVTSNAASSPDTVSLLGAGIDTPADGLRLVFSTSQNRSAPSDLDGAVVSDSIWVFLTDETGVPEPDAGITQVRFFTNGAPSQVENFDPWDYKGGPSAAPIAFNTTAEPDGSFTISAEADVTGEGTTNVVANFTISNFGPPVPAVQLAPGSLSFGDVGIGTAPSQNVTLTNVGTGPLNIVSLSVAGTEFALGATNCVSVMAPGGSCSIPVVFAPGAAGPYSGQLTVTTNAASSPDIVPLSGNGVAIAPAVQLSPASIDFGDVEIGATGTDTVTLTNTGTAPLSVGSVSTNSAIITVSSTSCPTTVNPGSSCSIDLEFAPDAAGAFNALASVVSNATSSPDLVSLSGNGTEPVEDGLRIVYSTSSNRNGPSDLDGSVVTDSIYVFVTDESGNQIPGVSITQVRFSTNGTQTQVENIAPYDYDGGNSATANPFDTTAEADGPFQISAEVDVVGEGTTNLVADFLIQNTVPQPVISVDPTSVDFGQVDVGSGSTPVTVTVTNIGTAPLVVSSESAPAPFAVASTSCGTVVSGDSCEIDVVFNPTVAGIATADLTIDSNSITGPVTTVPLTGQGYEPAPQVLLAPNGLTFPVTDVGDTTGVQSVSLTNTGDADLTISSISATNSDFGLSNNCPGTLGSGNSCDIDVVFSPSANGPISGSLEVVSNAASSTDTVALSGVGNEPAPAVSLTPSSLVFPLTNVGDSAATQTITLANTGDADLTVLSITGTNTDFGLIDNCPAALGAGNSCSIDVDFSPSASGAITGDVNVVTNAASSPNTAALSGEGFEAEALELYYSTSSDRSGAVPLDGAVINGSVYVFVNPQFPTTPISQVQFFFDGDLAQVESAAPYDFEGGSAASPGAFVTTNEVDGIHNINANVILSGGAGTLALNADFEIDNSQGSALIGITPGAALGASTYDADAFQITNTGDSNITQVVLDLSNSFLPDMVFDPVGTAGDNTAKCLEPNGGLSDAVGYQVPGNNCVDPFSDGSATDGYTTVTLNFNDFGPGEAFVFSTDVDPTTIKGYASAGNAGAISGLELSGTTATVTFSDGVESHETFGDSSEGGSVAQVPSIVVGEPSLAVSGVALAATTLSNGATAATVPDASQTILVSGPANSTVTLIHVNGDLEDAPPGGFNDLEAYEINEADALEYFPVALDASGNGSFDVFLLDGMNYFRAAVSDAGATGSNSNVVILELMAGAIDGPAALVEITPGGDLSGGTSTFLPGSFSITNLGDEFINSVSIDISTALLPNVVYDPLGLAGDTDASCLAPDSGGAATGYVVPADECDDPYSVGNAIDGFTTATLNFIDFGPGETITFHADVDPHSIQGASGAAASGKVNGTELSGSTVTVDFAVEGLVVAQVFKEDDSIGGSEATVTPIVAPTTPTLAVSGVTFALTAFSNGAGAAQVTDTSQTVTVSGDPLATIRLIQINTDVNGIVSGVPAAPYEANQAVSVVEHTVTLDGSGLGSIPVTLTDDLTYFMATTPAAGTTAIASNGVYLELAAAGGAATFAITPGAAIGASTFSGDSFTLANTGGSNIDSVTVDLGTAFFPDVVYDPLGLAGDATAGCFAQHATSDPVGLVPLTDPCETPFSNGSATEGYKVASFSFTDFGPGEQFVFTTDVDPTTIKGYDSAGNAGAISGLELSGSTVTVNFSDGTASSQTFGDGSEGGSVASVPSPVPASIGLSVSGTAIADAGFSNGALGGYVFDPSQTAVVSGPADTDVTLIVVDANLEDAPPGGFNDVDEFERNKALTVTYIDAVVGVGGTVDIPFTVSSTIGEATYVIAAADSAAGAAVGASGPASLPVYLILTDTPPPAGEVIYRVNNGGPQLLSGDAGMEWAADQSAGDAGGAATTGTPSPYLSPAYTDDNTFGDIDETITADASVPSYVPIELFSMERWDPDTNGEMTFEFPVSSGVEYEVRLYFAEIWDSIDTEGPRIFSVDVEGTTYGPIDIAAEVGVDVGTMKSYLTTVADDSLTISMLHGIENPSIKGIEILAAGETVSDPAVANSGILTTDTEGDGALPSDPVETTVTMPSAGGPYNGTINEGAVSDAAPAGFELFGQQSVVVVSPNAPGAGDPFEILFELDASILPVDPADVSVFQDGGLVGPCAADPCEVSRTVLGNGNLQIVVQTTTSSTWTFGFVPAVNLEADVAALDFADIVEGNAPTADVTFTHTGAPGAPPITVDPLDITVAGDTEFSILTAPATTQVLAAEDSFVVTVEYAPTAAPALHNASLSVVHDGVNSPTGVSLVGNSVEALPGGTVLYRINAGGAPLMAIDSGPDWDGDDPHPTLVQPGSGDTAGFPGVDPGPSVPATTPGLIFDTERYDGSGAGMQWEFDVLAGTPVEVRLYAGNGYSGTAAPNTRVFDVSIDGAVVFDDVDLSLQFGNEVGGMLSYETVSDGTIDVDFISGIENPLVNGIEIVVGAPQPNVLGVSPAAVDFGSVQSGESANQVITLTNLGEAGVDPDITINTVALAGGAPFGATAPSLPLVLVAGTSADVTVTYSPTTVDSDADTLEVGSTADNSLVGVSLQGVSVNDIPVSFGSDGLAGESLSNPTSLDFGPDGRLYVSQQNGMVYAYTISRDGAPAGSGSYTVTNTEAIDLIKNIPNHNDDGSLNTGETDRQVTGLLTAGTAANPVLYVSSSDPRIGAGGSGNDSNLDTNSGIISKLTWNGASWDKIDVVRGLPRSEENHASNGMAVTPDGNTLYLMQGGHTNQGAPSNNFAQTPEYALSAAMLKVDLAQINSSHGGSYDLPTVGRAAGAVPFGGNDGATQAVWDTDGPVQVYSPGYRNAYDVVLTQNGNLYTFDNGPNGGWGDVPVTSGGLCTNTSNEPGNTSPDNLHFVASEGYYGGHPNPTRANTSLVAGAVDGTPPYDTSVECTYLSSSGSLPPADGSLATVGDSTNGLTEYTASNFGGSMQGDLLAASFDGSIYRMKPTAAGDALVSLTGDANNPEEALFSGFGSTPLDVTAQGDGDIFPGTVWAATYGSNNITVFEPADFGSSCSGVDDAGLDEDGDGYDNADEIDNGTNPCSGGSQPTDWDDDLTSDLNDTDDDNDLILDVNDAFALDPNNGLTTSAPLSYPFDLNSVVLPPYGSFKNVGPTGFMLDPSGTTDYLTQYDEGNLNVGGATGVFSVDVSSTGDATNNDQDYGFQFGVNPASLTGPFTVHVQTVQPFPAGVTPTNYQSVGFYIGNGDQDNYLKLVAAANGSGGAGGTGGGGFQLGGEVGGVFAAAAQPDVPEVVGDAVDIDLYLSVDPTVVGDPTVDGFYRINGGPLVAVGSTTIPAGWVTGPDALAVGLISTSFGATPITPAWEFAEITLGAPDTTAPAAPTNLVATASDGQVDLDWDDNVEGDFNVYSVYRSTTSPVDTSGAPFAQPATSAYIDTLVTNGTTYHYVVTAEDTSLNESLPSNEDDATPIAPASAALFRVNVGGPEVAAADTTLPNWGADDATTPSSYRTNGADIYLASAGGAHPGPINMSDPSIPASAPVTVFESERYDAGSLGDALVDEMQWDFPIAAGTEVEVTLLFAELFSGIDTDGERVFDVQIEGGTFAAFDDIDPFAIAGAKGALAISAVVAVGVDGNLDIDLIHQVENPALKGIEIKIPEPRTITVVAPTEGEIVVGDEVTVTWTTSGGLLGDDHVHLELDAPPRIGTLPQNDSYTFTAVAPGPHTVTATVANTTHDEYTNPEANVVVNFTVEAAPADPLYRVNIGGPEVVDTAGNWTVDTEASPSTYLTGGGGNYFDTSSGSSSGDVAAVAASVPAGTPFAIFNTEQWDAAAAPPLGYSFPVAAGAEVEVRIYTAEIYAPLGGVGGPAGARSFDIAVDGSVPAALGGVEPWAIGGNAFSVGAMVSTTVVSDGVVDIEFLHGADNPNPKAIELVLVTPASADLAVTPASVDFGQVANGDAATDTVTLSNVLGSDGPVDITSLGTSGAAEFSLLSAPATPITLNPGDSLDLTAEFAPSAAGPFSGSIDIDHDGGSANIVVTLDGEGVEPSPVLYRVNAGGGALASLDSGPGWAADSGSLVAGSTTTGGYANSNGSDASVPPTTPQGPGDNVFVTERYGDTAADPMLWNFPVASGELVEVRLFMHSGWNGANQSGEREFDVLVEGIQILDDYDLVDDVGHRVGVMKSVVVTSDGNIDIDFGHVTENSVVNAIEIVTVDSNPSAISANPAPLDFGTVNTGGSYDEVLTLQNVGLVTGPSVVVDSSSFGVLADVVDDAVFPIVIFPGETHEIILTWSPPSDTTLSGTYSVDHNGSGSPTAVTVDGEAVTATNNPPTLDPIDHLQVIAGDLVEVAISAADLDPADTITLGISSTPALPGGAVFTDLGSGVGSLSWPTTLSDVSMYNIDISAFDGTDTTIEAFTLLVGEAVPLNVNAGGATTQPSGWVDEGPYRGGSSTNQPGATGTAVDMTHPSITSLVDVPPMEVFQTEVYGPQTFDFLVVDGTYEVRLLFAETYLPAAGDDLRLFDVNIEGVDVLSDYDVWETAGNADHVGVVETFLVGVSDANGLTVALSNNVDNAAIKGIMIRNVVHAANAGAGPVQIWDAGSAFVNGGAPFGVGDTIVLGQSAPANTPQSVFQNEVYGTSGWDFAVEDGDYEVQLFMAETYSGASPSFRQFDVTIDGLLVLDNFDILGAGYSYLEGFVLRFPTTVGDSNVDVDFANTTFDNASIKGIVIVAN